MKGAVSFDDLKTVNGKKKETFATACLAHVIENDEQWSYAMQEAALSMMPKKMRNLYVRILIHCNPLKPEKLWDDYKDSMSEDYKRNHDTDVSKEK